MLLKEAKIITNKRELTSVFTSGYKNSENIGLEYEKLGVNYHDNKAVSYEKMEKFLENFSEFEDYIPQYNNIEDKKIIGLKNTYGSISLEPGSQFELSLNPLSSIYEIDNKIKSYNALTKKLGKFFEIKWLSCGCQPLSTYENIKIIPKERYKYMTDYLPNVAKYPLVMMRETAGIQVGIDYSNEYDAIKKMRLSLKLAPVISAIYSNSPIHNGKLSKYKSYRSMSWLNTDNARCGLISKSLFENKTKFTFEDYTEILLDVPMIFIHKDNKYHYVKDLTFRQYLNFGYMDYKASIEDWENHISLYFPDARFKNYLEIRNHDSQKTNIISTIPALYKSIMYNKNAFEEIEKLLSFMEYEDFENIRQNAPKYGTNYKIKGKDIRDLAKEIMNISYQSLKNTNEEIFIEPIMELVYDKITPADIIIRNWEGCWNKDFNKFIEYSEL